MFNFWKKNRRVYLDNAGSTSISVSAERALIAALRIFGNPSAIYKEGVWGKNLLEQSKEEIGIIMGNRCKVVISVCSCCSQWEISTR